MDDQIELHYDDRDGSSIVRRNGDRIGIVRRRLHLAGGAHWCWKVHCDAVGALDPRCHLTRTEAVAIVAAGDRELAPA